MADVIQTNFTHTYNGKEFLTTLFWQPEEDVPALDAMFTIRPNITSKENIYIPQKLRKILRKHTTCGFLAAGGTANVIDKTITVEKVKANVEECVDTWADTIFQEALKKGVEVNDLSNTVVDDIIRRQFQLGVGSDLMRIVWFADDTSGSADWDQFDGFIRKFLDASSDIGAACFKDLDTETWEVADVLAADGAKDALAYLWENQDKPLRPVRDKMFLVTYTVFDNLLTTYEDTQSSAGLLRLIDGPGTGLTFRGVPVMPVPEWDENLADTDNPHSQGNGLDIGSNLIILTTKDNLIVGSDVASPQNEFKVRFNDDDDEKAKYIAKFKLGVEFVHPELICLAF